MHKISSIPPGAKKYVDIGRATNNMMVDIGKINFYVTFRPNLFTVPLILLVYLYMIYDEVGMLFLAAIAVIILCMFGQSFVNKFFRKVNFQRMGISDKRVKKINEII